MEQKRVKLPTVITVQLEGPGAGPSPDQSRAFVGYAKPLAWQVDSGAVAVPVCLGIHDPDQYLVDES